MKIFYSFLILSLISIAGVKAQTYKNGTLTTTTNDVIEGRLSIDNSAKRVSFKNKGISQIFNFNNIKNVNVNGYDYSIIQFNNEDYLASIIETGKASLYDLTDDTFLIRKEANEGQLFHLKTDKSKIAGTLLLLFNDCNTIRDQINRTDVFNKYSLKKISNSYNNCDYADYSPTERELDQANTFNTDIYRFYAGFQTRLNKTTINDFSSNNTTGFGLGLGVAASPSFMGKLHGNLFFDFDFSMMFTGNNDFNNGLTHLDYKVNSYKLSLGMEYIFNKNGTIQPFLGIGYGFTSDYYKGTIGTITFTDNYQTGFLVPKIGVLYKLKNNNHLGLTISYISEYENDLSFLFIDNDDDENITTYPFVINTSGISIGLNYYF